MADEDTSPKSRTGAAVKLGELLAKYKRMAREERKARAAAEAERDELKSRPSTEELSGKVKKYEDDKRSEKHRKAFDKAASDAKVRPEALDDLWELSKLDTSADEPDAKAISAAIADKTKLRPYLLSDATGQADPKQPLNPGPGSDRGNRSHNGGMTVKLSDLADGQWVRDNQDQLREAQSKGLVTYVD